MRYWHCLLAALGLFCLRSSAAEIIRVGGYPFSPFVTKQQMRYQGFSIQLLDALNQLQDRYQFQFTPTSPGTRHLGFQHHRFDMIFFENPAWGWQSQVIDFIPFNLEDGDVMIALAQPGIIEAVDVDTAHFKGNFPDRCSIQAANVAGGTDESLVTQAMFWAELLPEQKLSADHVHTFRSEVKPLGRVTHVRFNIFPDGGVSRLRLWGRSS